MDAPRDTWTKIYSNFFDQITNHTIYSRFRVRKTSVPNI